MADYEHMGRVVGGIEDWSPPQGPKRICNCGTIISQYNSGDFCHACQRSIRRELDKAKDEAATRTPQRRRSGEVT